jgi:hypothetical protein
VALRRLSTSSIQTNGKSSKLWDQTTFQSGMFALATVSLTSTASTIVFDNIPPNYTHLQIRALTVTNSASSGAALRFNDDSETTYYRTHALYGQGSTAEVYGYSGILYAPNFNGGAATTSPGAAVIDILDYASNSKTKVVRSFDGLDTNGSGGFVGLTSGLWNQLSPITKISFNLTSYLAGTHFALYGIKTV